MFQLPIIQLSCKPLNKEGYKYVRIENEKISPTEDIGFVNLKSSDSKALVIVKTTLCFYAVLEYEEPSNSSLTVQKKDNQPRQTIQK